MKKQQLCNKIERVKIKVKLYDQTVPASYSCTGCAGEKVQVIHIESKPLFQF